MENTTLLLEELTVIGLPMDLMAFIRAWINCSTLSCWIEKDLKSLLITGIQKISSNLEPENSFVISATVDLSCEQFFLTVTSAVFEIYQADKPYILREMKTYKGSYDSFVLHSNKAAENKRQQELHGKMPDHRS